MHELRAKDAELRRKDQQLFDREIELNRRQKEMESMRERVAAATAASPSTTARATLACDARNFAGKASEPRHRKNRTK